MQAAAAIACAREVLNKCVWPCGSIVWWSSHHHCPSVNFHTGRSIKLATRGVYIFDLFKTPRLSLLSAWCAKVQAAAAVACAREVLNKCVWPCGSIVWWSSHRDATSYQIICFELNVINKLYCRAHKILLHPAWTPSLGPAGSTNSSLFTGELICRVPCKIYSVFFSDMIAY